MKLTMDFNEWLNKVRFSRNVCMLIPMESCMGYPIITGNNDEFIIPFFRVFSVEKTEELSPPFAYIRINYPMATILTYNNLHTLPDWKNTDWNTTIKKSELYTAHKIDNYYKAICDTINQIQDTNQQDELLLNCLHSQDLNCNKSLIGWYEKLITEAKKYR